MLQGEGGCFVAGTLPVAKMLERYDEIHLKHVKTMDTGHEGTPSSMSYHWIGNIAQYSRKNEDFNSWDLTYPATQHGSGSEAILGS